MFDETLMERSKLVLENLPENFNWGYRINNCGVIWADQIDGDLTALPNIIKRKDKLEN
jgi:hypothetical protein